MGLFEGFRTDGGPTLYGPLKYPVTYDVLEAGFFYAASILFFSLCLSLIGVRGSQRLFTFIRVFIGVVVLGSVMVVNFGQEWEVGEVSTRTQYRAGLSKDIHAHISAKIGLRSINITLKGDPEVQEFNGGRVNETINYNERFSWDNAGFTVGRAGFGPFAGRFNQEFRAAQRKGTPYPILWVAEYFTIDGEGIRWGRHYLQAGYYAHILCWLALPLWVLSMVLYAMVLRYGGYFTLLTGGALLLANVIWATVRNPNELAIPFEDDWLRFKWGWTFWLCLATGVLCIVLGMLVLILEIRYPKLLIDFFDVDIANYLEEYYVDSSELSVESDGDKADDSFITLQAITINNRKEMNQYSGDDSPAATTEEPTGSDIYMAMDNGHGDRRGSNKPQTVRMYRMQTILGPRSRKATLAKRSKPAPPPRPEWFTEESVRSSVYANIPADKNGNGKVNEGFNGGSKPSSPRSPGATFDLPPKSPRETTPASSPQRTLTFDLPPMSPKEKAMPPAPLSPQRPTSDVAPRSPKEKAMPPLPESPKDSPPILRRSSGSPKPSPDPTVRTSRL